MRNCFADLGWQQHTGSPQLTGSLQLIATLPAETVDRLDSLLPQLASKHLRAMPLGYLHLPLQRLGDFDSDLTQADYTALGTALNQAYADRQAFSLAFSQPQLVDVGVAVTAEATPEWHNLIAATRRALTQTRKTPLPEAAGSPRIMLLHAIGEIDEAAAAAALQASPALGPVTVAEVALVSMSARPELGTFDYHILANFKLG